MKKHNFISLEDFCEKYSLNRNSFESMKARKDIKGYPAHIFMKDGKDSYVDEKYFIYRKEKEKRLWNMACDNYYILIEKMNERRLAKALHQINNKKSIENWSSFLYKNLFVLPDEKITNTRLSEGLYLFLRYTNWIIRRGIA